MKILRLKQVIDTTGLARSTIYKYISDGTFVKPIKLNGRNSGWLEHEVQDWIASKVSARDAICKERTA